MSDKNKIQKGTHLSITTHNLNFVLLIYTKFFSHKDHHQVPP